MSASNPLDVTRVTPDKYLSDEQFRKLMEYVRNRGNLARKRGQTRGIFIEFVIEMLA
ncbi:MAG: hypothetical protein ACYSP9_07285 [Planctomycetota bacterium]